MKLLMITAIEESKADVAQLLKQAKIGVFSSAPVEGHKEYTDNDLMDDWFSRGADKVKAVFLFSFTTDEKAAAMITLIQNYNATTNTAFPVRAFLLPVEAASSPVQ